MRAQIAYYDPPRRPAPGVRPDFTKLPLSGRSVTIGDMRDGPGDCSLDREGFAAVAAPTSVRDFYDGDEVARVYPAEAAELLRALTGCAATALLNRPVIRVSGRAGERPAGATFTGDFVHADFSAAAAEQMLRRN
ncbi:MAG: CmcJ/NvfI family oxidoreductase, partial [Trebonia sp.]|uniref:CmcJ/NvfI family oxidoreductase n=1 Tax=Trebonia sp. TaxID=2767075 RepID=UPI003BAEBF53